MISERIGSVRFHAVERNGALPLMKYGPQFGLATVLILAALLNLLGLQKAGYGNAYYAAAVRSMMENWHAFFFNSLDPTGFVTIDKPPLGFWLQVLSAKIFGFSGFALMLPQAVAGVLSVGLLYRLVGRLFGSPAGFLAALALALMPISVVADRNNIVDSTLVFAVLLGAWAVTRAVETCKLRWLLLCALFVGLGFNIKMLQAYLVVPAFGLMYLVGAGAGWRRRILHLGAAGVVLLAVSLSWVTAVDVTPANQRPWVGSTTTNSALDLAIGYNGLQRLTGNSRVGNRGRNGGATTGGAGSATRATQGVPPGGGAFGPGGAGENGAVGAWRLLNNELGPQVSWLLPLAVIGFFAALWETRRRSLRLDARQSSIVMWGAWLLTTAVFFSVAGFFHTYYLVMVAPAISALAGIGIASLWRSYRRSENKLWWLLPVSLGIGAAVQFHLLTPYAQWSRWLTPLIAGVTLIAAITLILVRLGPRLPSHFALPAVLLGAAVLLAAPATWSVTSAQASSSGMLPRAGPASANGGPGGFGGGPGRFRPPNGRFAPPGAPGFGGRPPGAGFRPPAGFRFGRGGPGAESVNTRLVRYLEKHQGKATYLFATTNAGTAEPYIIATGKSVMALGGFTGSDPILTTAKLAALVKRGVVRYFMLGGGFGPDGRGGSSTWVQRHCSSVPASQYSSATPTAASGPSDFGGGTQFYDCATVK